MPEDADEFLERASLPFLPGRTDARGTAVDLQARLVEALEYIAAQLGEICRKMDHLEPQSLASLEDREQMKELLKKL